MQGGTGPTWQTVLIAALLISGSLVFAYRLYRTTRGGPAADAAGGAALLGLLGALAWALAADMLWVRWVALAYAVLFGIVVMPIWTLAVLIPLPPRALDWGFAVLYWLTLPVIGIAALLSRPS